MNKQIRLKHDEDARERIHVLIRYEKYKMAGT
jgi:hypothetical protein